MFAQAYISTNCCSVGVSGFLFSMWVFVCCGCLSFFFSFFFQDGSEERKNEMGWGDDKLDLIMGWNDWEALRCGAFSIAHSCEQAGT